MKHLLRELRLAITSVSGVPAGTIPGVITLARAEARPTRAYDRVDVAPTRLQAAGNPGPVRSSQGYEAGVLDGQPGGVQSPAGSVVCPSSIR